MQPLPARRRLAQFLVWTLGWAALPASAEPPPADPASRLIAGSPWWFDAAGSRTLGEAADRWFNSTKSAEPLEASLAALIERGKKDRFIFERRDRELHWISRTVSRDGADELLFDCPIALHAAAPGSWSATISGPCRGAVPPEARAPSFAPDELAVDPRGLMLVDDATLLELPERGSVHVMRHGEAASGKVARIAIANVHPNASDGDLDQQVRRDAATFFGARAQIVDATGLADAIARSGGLLGACDAACVGAAGAKAGVDYVVAYDLTREAKTHTGTLVAASAVAGQVAEKATTLYSVSNKSLLGGLWAPLAEVDFALATHGRAREAEDARVLLAKKPAAEARARLTKVAFPAVHLVTEQHATPFATELGRSLIGAKVGGKLWFFTNTDKALLRASEDAPDKWLSAPVKPSDGLQDLLFGTKDRLWATCRTGVCWAPLAEVMAGKIAWRITKLQEEGPLETDGVALIATSGDDSDRKYRRSVDGKVWTELTLPPSVPDSLVKLVPGPQALYAVQVAFRTGTTVVFRSTDGKSWEKAFDSAGSGLVECEKLVPGEDAASLICRGGVVVWRKGGTWTVEARTPSITAEAFDFGAADLTLGDTRYATLDGGASWHEIRNPSRFKDSGHWFQSTQGKLLSIRDGAVLRYDETP